MANVSISFIPQHAFKHFVDKIKHSHKEESVIWMKATLLNRGTIGDDDTINVTNCLGSNGK
jgi:hypothetical protein